MHTHTHSHTHASVHTHPSRVLSFMCLYTQANDYIITQNHTIYVQIELSI